MAYSRKQVQRDDNIPVFFTVTPQHDICAHPCILILEVIHNMERWYIVNFYNDVGDKLALNTLLKLDLDLLVPTLVVGDFNTHSHSWLLPTTALSHWAWKVEEWATRNLLTLANKKGVITRKGAGDDPDAVLDLAWFNEAMVSHNTFHSFEIDWAGSLSSDHAMLCITGDTHKLGDRPTPDQSELGYVITAEDEEPWTKAYWSCRHQAPIVMPLTSPQEIDHTVLELAVDINRAMAKACKRCKPFHPKATPWWNEACLVAARSLRTALGTQARNIALA